MKLLLNLFLLSYLNITYSFVLNGKYCGNIMGNTLDLDVNKTTQNANITANIFGTDLNCPKEKFNLTDNNIYFSKNKSDCMNKILSDYGGCPCPPPAKYDSINNKILITNKILGNIELSSC